MTTRAISGAVLAIFLLAGNARATLLTKQFQFGDPVVSGTPWGTIVTVPGCRSIGNEGEPILPVYSACFVVPSGEIVMRVSIESLSDVALDGSYDVAPMQAQAPLGAPAPRAISRDSSIYRSSAAFPAERVFLATEQMIAGLRLAFIDVRPCAYIPSSGTVLFSSSIRVSVETAPSSAAVLNAPAARMRKAARDIRDRVANPDLAVEYSALEEAVTDTTPASELAQYVIITSSDFAAAFEPLASLRARFGMRSRIVDTAWIAANFDGDDEQEQIRNFIKYAYENWSTQYVLLGGDDDIIPHRGLYVKNGTYIDIDIPSDLYYACLDGNWNTDGDAYFGEPGEEDLLPEVIVGRLPVDSIDEIANVIEKISSYELSPVSSQCKSAAMLGELLWSEDSVDTWGGDYKDEILYGSSSWGFTTAGLPGDFDVTTLYDDDAGSWVGSQVVSLLNEGVNIVNHCGHSSLFAVMRVTSDDVALFTNDGVEAGYCIIYSHGCYAAAFDNRDYAGTVYSEDCIGEDLVNSP
ncbi:MAG: C25 family cysteine peptidase, partial [Candidatus Krumholzibacteria bacterium]|nr:C25 family cysteine peptidase [Candidatus Krumholzibacteria bacterium]